MRSYAGTATAGTAGPGAAPPRLEISKDTIEKKIENNIEYFSLNFEGLVLGCIDADFCK